jgi:hypothetical protein
MEPDEPVLPKLQVTLTCKCGTPQYPHSRDIPAHCVNSFCRAALNPSEEDIVRYKNSIQALLDAAELNTEALAKALCDANSESARVRSPFTISIRQMQNE